MSCPSRALYLLCACLFVLFATGCTTSKTPGDPWEGSNRDLYSFNQAIDRAVVSDVAKCYTNNVPGPVRSGIFNFFDNLTYINIILNDDLQGNFAQGWRDTKRCAVNTTIGVLGVIDVASSWDLPRSANDFGITLGKWGVKQGPYVMLPILGPTTTREAPGLVVSYFTNPMYWLDPPWYVSIPMDATSFVDKRARLQPEIDIRDRVALDPYSFTRDAYLQHRQAKVTGQPPSPPPDLYNDTTLPTTTTTTAPTTMPARP